MALASRCIEDVRAAQDDLGAYQVRDPACGSGNFLYVAYRELREIEAALAAKEREFRAAAGLEPTGRTGLVTLQNLHGIEREPFAVKLARVTLWMGHALAVRKLKLDELVLPLESLPGIWLGDALKVDWPSADAIIGNPPYHGSQQLRSELGDDYATFLGDEFGIGLKDYAVYWFRKAHKRLEPGGRAGFVATNSISQNRNRGPTLEWIIENGGVITNAVSKQAWPGVAVVNVSIVNWVKLPADLPAELWLDGQTVTGITPSLRPTGTDLAEARALPQNRGRAFQGSIPAGAGFVLNEAEASKLLTRSDASYAQVVRPYLIGEDVANDPRQAPRRWIIDFASLPLEAAASFSGALDVVRERVKPERDVNKDRGFREKWWQFGRPRGEMRAAITLLDLYIAANRIGKRTLFTWQGSGTCPSDLIVVFAFDDDYSLGVLTSKIHGEWARAQSSTLRIDIRYTPTTAFETFPWPSGDREEIAEITRALIARRSEICLTENIGLTKLYNQVDDGAWADLRDLHRRLDEAVAAAYGWPRKVAHDPDETNRRLLELNRDIAAGKIDYRPFA